MTERPVVKGSRRSLGARPLIFSAFGAVVFLSLVRLAFGVARFDRLLDEYKTKAAYDDRVQDALDHVYVSVAESESGVRGWQVTRDRRFLEPYTRASLTRDQALNDLVEIESDAPKARAIAERVADRTRDWANVVAEPIVADDPKLADPAKLLSIQLTGRARMDSIRGDLLELSGDLRERRKAEGETLTRYRADLLTGSYVGTAIVIALTFLLAYYLAYRFKAPLDALLSYVRENVWEKADRKPLEVRGVGEIEALAAIMERAAENGMAALDDTMANAALVGELVEARTVDAVSTIAVRWITARLGASGAAMWVAEDASGLRLAACYGVDRETLERGSNARAESVLRSGSVERVDNLADSGRVIRSALVDVHPNAIVLVPVRGAHGVVGVMELVGDKIGDPTRLAAALDRIGVSIDSAISDGYVKELGTALSSANDQLRAQNEELRAQEEELRAQREELLDKQKSLAQSNVSLEKGSRLKSEFLSDMSHELRTPLNAVIGFSELLLGETYGPLADLQKERIGDISSAGKQLLTLVNDILDLSRIEAGRVELASAPMDLRSAIEEACSLVAPIAEKKRIKVTTALLPEALMVLADHGRVRQVVVNLLSNAIKFTPSSGTVVVKVSKKDDMARVAVEDTGIGISPEDARKLFAPFTQLKGGLNAGGAGLGLSISKRLVELMDGEIGLESTVGKGSTFHFTLPLSDVAPSSPRRAPQPSPATKDAAKRRVLVVDGNPNRVRSSEELLARAGYDVHVAFNTEAASTELAKGAVDLVVVDLALPASSGFRLVETIASSKATNALSQELAVIVLTDRTLSSAERADLSKSTDLIAEKGVMTGAGFLDAVSGLLEQSAPLAREKPRILVVDDSAINRSVLRAMLESAGFEVVEADRAKEGIRMAQAAPPQVILMDVRMPDMSGLDATRALREDARTKGTPVIAVSAQAMSGDKELALEAGCNAYVTKPVARQELLSAITHALRDGGAE